MKYLKNIIAVLILIGIFHMSYSAELSVDEIKVLDANTLSVTLSENPNLEVGEIQWEIRVLNDVKLRGVFISETDDSQVELILEDPLMPNTTYSLLTVLGAEGSIDFTTPWNVEWLTASNLSSVEMQDIDSIEVVDDRTLMVYYRDPITASTLEFKLLAESRVTKIEKLDFYSPEILISIEPPFISEKDYILMFIELQDVSGEFLEFDTGIYDFVSPIIDEIPNTEESESDVEQVGNIDDTLEVVEVQTPNEEVITPETELEAAGEEVSLEKSDELLDTQEVATMLTETPETGAATWVLVLTTLVINTFYYLSRRKKSITLA